MKIFDVHTHFSTETSVISEDAVKLGFNVHNSTIPGHIEKMETLGIDHALLSCPTIKFTDDREKCIEYARSVNDMGASAKDAYPGRLSFAAFPSLPYVDAACSELERAWDMGAAAVSMVSNYEGIYLGDESIEPLWTLLEKLDCPVVLHPATPPVWPENPITGKILPMFEFITDTTRAVIDMIYAGVFLRHPGLKIIVPHAGSCLPVAFNRMLGIIRSRGYIGGIPYDNLYYDLACNSFPQGVPILLQWTDPSHIFYGTDYPAIQVPALRNHLASALEAPDLQDSMEDVMYNNALRVFPRCFI